MRPIRSAAVTSMTISPNPVAGGGNSGGTLTFSRPIPAATWPAQPDAVVRFSSSDPDVAALFPGDDLVPAGSTSHTFRIFTRGAPTSRSVTFTAYFDGAALSSVLSVGAVTGVSVSSLGANVTTLRGGDGGVATVALAAPAPAHSARCRLVQLFSSSGAATVPTTVTDRHEHPVESCGHQRRGGHHWIGVVRERHVDHAVRGQRPRRDLVGCLFQRRQQDKDVHVHDRCCRVGDGERAVAASASTTEGRAWRRNVSGQSPPASPGGRRAATASESTTQRAAEPTNHRRRDTTESALRFSTHADRLAPVERREGEPRANP